MASSPNPENEYYRRQILFRRRYHPLYGLLLVISGGLGLIGFLSDAPLNARMAAALGPATGLVNVTILLLSLAAFLVGSFLIFRGYRPPTSKEVQAFRQRERYRLFSQAQGRQPWWSFLITRVVIILVGIVFGVGGLFIIGNFSGVAWDGWFYLFVAGFLFLLAFYFIPRERKKLPSQSAEQLAHRWISGESTTGDDY